MNRSTTKKKTAPDDEMAIQPSEDSVGYMLSATYRLLNRALQSEVSRFDVPTGTWVFLRTIWAEDGLTQREIGQRVGIQEAATGAALDKLERLGLIERARNPGDRRKINVCLTAHGRELGHQLIPRADGLTDRLVDGFEPFEVAQLCSYLRRVRKNLEAYGPTPSAKGSDENTIDS